MKKINELKAQLREKRDRLGELAQVRELNDEQKAEMLKLKREVENIKDELDCEIRELQIAQLQAPAQSKSKNTELREFLRDAKKGSVFSIPMNRESMSYGAQSGGYQGTEGYVQGIEVKELIDTERKDADILAAAGVPMTTGVVGNKIQWAFAGGVEAVFANELAHTTERTISLDKQSPVQNRLTLRVRFSNQMLENSNFDLQGYIVKHVSDAIRDKINWAAASTTKATETLYGGFAQDTESGTYGQEGYVPGKQAGTYSTFSKETAAEMIAKIAKRNLKLNNCLFVMGAEDYWEMKVTPMDQGSGIMLIGNDGKLLGIPVFVDNAINRSTQKGALSGHNIGLGNFAYMPTMQHGNIRLSIDGGSAVAADTDEVIVTINADFSMTVLKDGADAFVLYAKS